ncbi:MAG: carboxypeptidase-like regulatory domain-containing protein, partial [Paludibacteraceae bacterium]|nr:carboxypeptidase-like regulatory domain-containing protein [Paludibacteraceae bacterium]
MKKQIIFLLFIFVSVFSYSQVHGFVRDNEGQVIPGVHVRWLGTDAGTVSDDSGHFRISPSVDTDLLIFSSVGYASDTVNVSGMKAEDHQNIILNDNTELSELTV